MAFAMIPALLRPALDASLALLLAFVLVAFGCTTPPRDLTQVRDEIGSPAQVIAVASPRERTGFGPPPYRYWRIVGGSVPRGAEALEWAQDTPAPMAWNFIGPRPVANEYWSGTNNAGGRVVGLACHPTIPAVAYAASASGGVWKTSDSGANWTPLTDRAINMNHGAIALDRGFPEAVYAGTGEYTTGSAGGGLLRSLDGGATWTLLANTTAVGGNCSGLAVVSGSTADSPAAIHIAGSNGYRRKLAGQNAFTLQLSADISSLCVDPLNPQRVFVAVNGGGIRRSVNGGGVFNTLTNGLPTAAYSRIVLAQARSNPSVLYAAFVNPSTSGLLGLYRTADGGDSWTLLANTPDFPRPQAWYDLSIGVDPLNPDHVFCGGVSPVYQVAGVIESTNGGQSWTEISGSGGQIHPDQHCVAFGADNTPWFGCDGGVWRRVGGSWINCNATLSAIQNYTIHEHPNDANRVMAGTQDNGMAGTSTGSVSWPQLTAGDGGYGAYLADVYTTLFTTYVYLKVYRKSGSNTTDISGPWSGDAREWISPLVADQNGGATLYGGTNRLWRNTASTTSASWTAISDTAVANNGTVTAIASVPGVPNAVWVGNSNGGVWRTLNGGTSWTSVRSPDGVRINSIDPRPGDAATACIARGASSNSRVLRTTNASTWTNLTGTLPGAVRQRRLRSTGRAASHRSTSEAARACTRASTAARPGSSRGRICRM